MTSTSNLPTLVDKLYKSLDNIPNEVFLRQPYGDKWKEFTYEASTAISCRNGICRAKKRR